MLFGLAKPRQIPLPTWKGWLILLVIAVVLLWWLKAHLYHFLAVDTRLPKAQVLLVEGWVSDDSIAAAKKEFDQGHCQWICTAGVYLDQGNVLSEYKTWAELAAARLIVLGVPEERIIRAPAGEDRRHRTYKGFHAAKAMLAAKGLNNASINVLSEGAHSRRSRLVFTKIFGTRHPFGMLSIPPAGYDPDRWWTSSSGMKDILMECIACFYEKVADGGRAEKES